MRLNYPWKSTELTIQKFINKFGYVAKNMDVQIRYSREQLERRKLIKMYKCIARQKHPKMYVKPSEPEHMLGTLKL